MRFLLPLLLASCLPARSLIVDVDRLSASDGTVLLCETPHRPCSVVWSATIPALAWSSPGLVQLHPALGRKPAGVQKFVFLHEIAHLHAPMGEKAADCWAAGRAEEIRVMSAEDWHDVREQVTPERWRGVEVCRGTEAE